MDVHFVGSIFMILVMGFTGPGRDKLQPVPNQDALRLPNQDRQRRRSRCTGGTPGEALQLLWTPEAVGFYWDYYKG
jgi:hypothetical protein